MAESDVEELGVLSQLVVADHVEDFDPPGGGGADEEFVPLGRELNALANAPCVECVKYTNGFSCDI